MGAVLGSPPDAPAGSLERDAVLRPPAASGPPIVSDAEASFEASGAEPELAVPDLPARATSVLLVEDSAEDAALIASQLRAVWSDLFDVGRVATLREALRLFGVGRADCVLLDLTLPDARELEALQRLVGEAPDVPIVILTGVDDGPLALRAVREGAQDYLIKGRADGEAIGRAIQYAIQRKRAEVAERTAADLFRVALQGTGMVVCHQDRDLRYTWVHTTPGSAFPVATLGKTDADLLSPEEGATIEAIKRKVLASGTGSIQEVTVTVAGEPRVFRLVVEPMRNPTGTIVGVTSATFDITDRVRAEEALHRAHGELAHFALTVAHELRGGGSPMEVADALLAWADAAQVELASEPVGLQAAFHRAYEALRGEIERTGAEVVA